MKTARRKPGAFCLLRPPAAERAATPTPTLPGSIVLATSPHTPTDLPTEGTATGTPAERRRRRLAFAVLALAALTLALLALPGPGLVPGAVPDSPAWVLGVFGGGLGISPGLYLGLLYAAIALWLGIWLLAPLLGARTVAVTVVAAIVLFALAPPLLSLDVFSYVSYARLGAEHGLNPYEVAPAAIADDQAAARVGDFRTAVSVYGPLFTAASYPLGATTAPIALWGFKALAALSLAAIALLTSRLAALRGVDRSRAVAFVALNPLVLVHVVGGAHNDGAMVALGLLGVVAALAGHPRAAGLALVASAAVKAAGALYAPFALAGSRQRIRLAVSLALGAVAVAAFTAVLFGGAAAEALGVAGENQGTVSRWSVPGTLSRLTGAEADVLRALLAAAYLLAVAGLLIAVIRGADWVRAAGWAAAGLLVATAWMVPWYLIWALPLAAVARDRALTAVLVALTTFQAINAVPL